MERYGSYRQLSENEQEGIDYRIRFRIGRSGIAVMAPHGGGIETGTSEIADAVADAHHTLYCFEGLKERGNARLHLASILFDEPVGTHIAKNAESVLSIHGCREEKSVIYLGGRDPFFKEKVEAHLNAAGFSVQRASRLAGTNPQNICNSCRSLKGVQLEISRGLRAEMFDHLHPTRKREGRKGFEEFVFALRTALEGFCAEQFRAHTLKGAADGERCSFPQGFQRESLIEPKSFPHDGSVGCFWNDKD